MSRSTCRLRLWLLGGLAWLPVVASAQVVPSVPPPSVLKKLSVEQLMDIQVTSVSKRPEKLFETASAIQVITADDVRRAGATSLPEALRLATNLEVAQVDARQWAITARGFNNVFADKMLVVIDGRSVYTPLYAGVYWDVQDVMLEDLDRIEVISGPGATQWGANAVNGVINITTKSAKDTQGGLISGGLGSDLRDATAARFGGKIAPGIYYRTYAKFFERSNSVRPDSQDSSDAWRMFQGGFRLDADTGNQDTVTLQGDTYNGVLGQIGPNNISVNGVNALSRWTHTFVSGSDLQVQLYYDRTHRRIPGSFAQNLNTTDLDVQNHHALNERHNLVWGFGYRVVADDVENTPANAFLPPRVTREWFTAFAQDEISVIKDRLMLTLGTKIEHNDYTGVEFDPSIRISWTPSKENTVWSSVSRAIRTPSRIDRDLYSPAAPPYRIAGGSHVVSEKLIAYELGYRKQFDAPFAASLATFYNLYDDLRSLEPLNPPFAFPVEASSGLRGWSAGAELTAEWQAATWWRLRAGYTELRVHSEPQPGTRDRSTRDSIARDPNHQAQLRSLIDLPGAWEWDTTGRYVAPIGNQSMPGYTEVNVRLGWRPAADWNLSLSGNNLLHDQHAEFNAPAGRREIKRSIQSQASWRF